MIRYSIPIFVNPAGARTLGALDDEGKIVEAKVPGFLEFIIHPGDRKAVPPKPETGSVVHSGGSILWHASSQLPFCPSARAVLADPVMIDAGTTISIASHIAIREKGVLLISGPGRRERE